MFSGKHLKQKIKYLKFLFTNFNKGNIKAALTNGAIIIDVRTAQEYDTGRVPGSINIPVDRIASSIDRIRAMNKPVIFCCSSGTRSKIARTTAKQLGLKNVFSGGSWENVLRILNKR